jgi:hypothetical protein
VRLKVAWLKGVRAVDELLLMVAEREAVAAGEGGAVQPSNFDKASLARSMRLA